VRSVSIISVPKSIRAVKIGLTTPRRPVTWEFINSQLACYFFWRFRGRFMGLTYQWKSEKGWEVRATGSIYYYYYYYIFFVSCQSSLFLGSSLEPSLSPTSQVSSLSFLLLIIISDLFAVTLLSVCTDWLHNTVTSSCAIILSATSPLCWI